MSRANVCINCYLPYTMEYFSSVKGGGRGRFHGYDGELNWTTTGEQLVPENKGHWIITDILNEKNAYFYVLNRDKGVDHVYDANYVLANEDLGLTPTSTDQSIEDYAKQVKEFDSNIDHVRMFLHRQFHRFLNIHIFLQ